MKRFIFACFPHVYRGLPCVKRDCVVICIRYKDFSAGTHDVTGLHGRAERGPHGVTVYLVPGLTACQRRAVIRRLRQEASRYVGPALPLPQLAVALCLDRVRSAARIAGAIVRLHPAVTLLPGALVAALMALFVIASADGPGLATGQRAGLADAVAVGPGAPQAVAEAVVPARPRRRQRTRRDAEVNGPGEQAQRRHPLRGVDRTVNAVSLAAGRPPGVPARRSCTARCSRRFPVSLPAGARRRCCGPVHRPPAGPAGLRDVERGVGVGDQGRGRKRARRALGDAGARRDADPPDAQRDRAAHLAEDGRGERDHPGMPAAASATTTNSSPPTRPASAP